jgi:hypothetical protein
MRKPNESLDDFIVEPASEINKPPPPVSLGLTGEVELLKPLTRREILGTTGTYRLSFPFQPLWFRRLIAIGSGSLVVTALVLISAIFIGIRDQTPEYYVAINESPYSRLTEDPIGFDSFSPSSVPPATGGSDVVGSSVRRKSSRPNLHLAAANRPKRETRPILQPEDPEFFPTTLIIYAENGVINTRIEPWIQAGDKKTLTFNN